MLVAFTAVGAEEGMDRTNGAWISALFSRGEVMSIPEPWLVAQHPPHIQRTEPLQWRSRSRSLSSRGASANSSARSSSDPLVPTRTTAVRRP